MNIATRLPTYTSYCYPEQPQMQVEVILASKPRCLDIPPIYTIRLRYPRIIHGEIMTHRDFSRNARSSRAVPVKTMLNEVCDIPFVPWHWGANQKGMQADRECKEILQISDWENIGYHGNPAKVAYNRVDGWLKAASGAASIAEAFMDAGYHKQIVNRLLEPFSWIDTLVTSTKWSNFLWLRDHKDAEPHFQDLARMIAQAIKEAPIQSLETQDWHLPYVTPQELQALKEDDKKNQHPNDSFISIALKLSAARCARISYAPFDGDPSIERELERYNSLVKSDRIHASPLEHQAKADWGFPNDMDVPALCGNLSPGWIQYRKMVANEAR